MSIKNMNKCKNNQEQMFHQIMFKEINMLVVNILCQID